MWVRRLLNLDTVSQTVGVIERQNQLIIEWQQAYAAQRAEMDLRHVRNVRDLVEQFLYAHEAGIDVRDELLDGLRDLNDHVARLEEHAPR